MRLLVCAGGTGGGVYPALSIVQAAKEQGILSDVLWVGGKDGIETDLVPRAEIRFEAIPAAGLHGINLKQLPRNIARLLRGEAAASKIIATYRPDVLLSTGGYVAVPTAFAGRHVPTLLYVPDIEPGLAIKTLARFADRICLIADDSRKYFPGRSDLVVTGHPVRSGLTDWTAESARDQLGLSKDLPVLLVFGGSLGAHSINRAVLDVLPALLEEIQVLHISGERDWVMVEKVADQLRNALRLKYHPFPYLHDEMGAAYRSADLILSRAGASAVGEFPLFGKPALLVPYPHAWRYQKVNADFLESKGAALTIRDEQLADQLLETVRTLFKDNDRRSKMAAAMNTLAKPEAAKTIAGELDTLAQRGRKI